ncbi:MAG: hypothetical protein ACI93R_002640 [Flavobacteriales bacterium]|jgi:hypothetical protein
MTPEILDSIYQTIDAANALDPNQETLDDGTSIAKELIYGQRMSNTLAAFKVDASPELKIAVRAQHLERWKSLRTDYPEGRTGYKQWRAELGLFHGKRCVELIQSHDLDEDTLKRIAYLIQKRQIKRDSETQCLEDVACLVFLEYYLVPFATKHSHEKLINIIQKTWNKMSAEGQQAALKLPLDNAMLALITEALS